MNAGFPNLNRDNQNNQPQSQVKKIVKLIEALTAAERELTDILLNHSVGFDRELDLKIRAFYEKVADAIQRSLDLGIEMKLVRDCDSRVAAYCILGGIKQMVGESSQRGKRDIEKLIGEILAFGLRGVARPELLAPPTDSVGAKYNGARARA